MKKHLAIFHKTSAEDILSGKKTIETRFSKSKIAPFGVISSGDLVYMKPVGKEPIGQFRVKKVIFYDGITESDLEYLKQNFESEINEPESFWKSKKGSKYASLIFIGDLVPFLTSPIKVKKNLKGWVVMDN